MKGGSLTNLMEECEDMRQLAASIKHLSFECGGQFYKFDKFDDRFKVAQSRVTDRDGRETNMVDYYNQVENKRLNRVDDPTVISTGTKVLYQIQKN